MPVATPFRAALQTYAGVRVSQRESDDDSGTGSVVVGNATYEAKAYRKQCVSAAKRWNEAVRAGYRRRRSASRSRRGLAQHIVVTRMVCQNFVVGTRHDEHIFRSATANTIGVDAGLER